jgi:hypothetical protein
MDPHVSGEGILEGPDLTAHDELASPAHPVEYPEQRFPVFFIFALQIEYLYYHAQYSFL